jgi:hypothetical protein
MPQANALLETFWQRYGDREDLGQLLGHVMGELWAQGYQEEALALGERVMAAHPDSPSTVSIHKDTIARYLAAKNIARANVLLELFWQRLATRLGSSDSMRLYRAC